MRRIGFVPCTKCRRFRGGKVKVANAYLRSGPGEVIVGIEFQCPKCGALITAGISLASQDFLGFVSEWLQDGDHVVALGSASHAVVTGPPTPSVRTGTPRTPIDEEYVRKAVAMLQRTSFRMSTKSWRGFMRRMGQ